MEKWGGFLRFVVDEVETIEGSKFSDCNGLGKGWNFSDT